MNNILGVRRALVNPYVTIPMSRRPASMQVMTPHVCANVHPIDRGTVSLSAIGCLRHTPMKIVHIANHGNRHGNGIVNAMVDLACAQARLGHHVTVLTGGGDFDGLLRQEGVRHVVIAHRAAIGLAPFKALLRIACFLRQAQPDVVHCHMVAGLVLVKLARALGLAPRCLLVSTIHNEFDRSARIMGWADRVVGVAAAVSASMVRRGVPNDRISTIYNGVIGSPRVDKRDAATTDVTLRPRSIITVAGMYKRKGIDVLLHAFQKARRRVPDAHLYLVGDGPDRAAFEALTVQLGLGDAVEFMGLRHDASALMKQADVFVLASRRDPCPLVIIEAREAGCAIVASDVDGIPQQLEFGRAGVLVPPDDVDRLADAVTGLLIDPEQARTLRVAAQENLAWLSVERAAGEYLALYAAHRVRAERSARASEQRQRNV